MRDARSKSPEPIDLELLRLGGSCDAVLGGVRSSWLFGPFMSADEGAVEALLCRDELSVDVALVVLDRLLPLRHGQSAMTTMQTTQL